MELWNDILLLVIYTVEYLSNHEATMKSYTTRNEALALTITLPHGEQLNFRTGRSSLSDVLEQCIHHTKSLSIIRIAWEAWGKA